MRGAPGVRGCPSACEQGMLTHTDVSAAIASCDEANMQGRPYVLSLHAPSDKLRNDTRYNSEMIGLKTDCNDSTVYKSAGRGLMPIQGGLIVAARQASAISPAVIDHNQRMQHTPLTFTDHAKKFIPPTSLYLHAMAADRWYAGPAYLGFPVLR